MGFKHVCPTSDGKFVIVFVLLLVFLCIIIGIVNKESQMKFRNDGYFITGIAFSIIMGGYLLYMCGIDYVNKRNTLMLYIPFLIMSCILLMVYGVLNLEHDDNISIMSIIASTVGILFIVADIVFCWLL